LMGDSDRVAPGLITPWMISPLQKKCRSAAKLSPTKPDANSKKKIAAAILFARNIIFPILMPL
jgi:hypothetical protein